MSAPKGSERVRVTVVKINEINKWNECEPWCLLDDWQWSEWQGRLCPFSEGLEQREVEAPPGLQVDRGGHQRLWDIIPVFLWDWQWLDEGILNCDWRTTPHRALPKSFGHLLMFHLCDHARTKKETIQQRRLSVSEERVCHYTVITVMQGRSSELLIVVVIFSVEGFSVNQ